MRYVGKFKTIEEETIRVEIDSGRLPRSQNTEEDEYALPPSNQVIYRTYNPIGERAYTRAAVSGGSASAWIETSKVDSDTQTNGRTTTFDGVSYTGLRMLSHVTNKNSGVITYGGEINMISDLFYGDSNIERVFIPIECTVLGEDAISRCSGLVSLKHTSLTKFGARCLKDCSSLSDFELLPYEQTQYIGENAFNGCTALHFENIYLDGCTLGNYAFQSCGILRAELHNLTSVPSGFFQGCTSLRDVELYNVDSFNVSAFTGCTALERITLLDGIPSLSGTFSGIKASGILYADNEDPITPWMNALPGGWSFEDGVLDLIFAGESPVMIEQSSPDGLFSPIKSRAATLTVLTRTPFYDMYSPTVQGTLVDIHNLTSGECIFTGFLTPCQYNQPYVGLDSLELEAVDRLSTLEDINYKYLRGSASVVSIIRIIKYLIHQVAGYKGNIYGPTKLKGANSYTHAFEGEYINDENFYDDDDEHTPWTCYDVLEEIGRIYGVSFIPYGDDVYIIDPKINSREEGNEISYYNYDTGETVTKTVKKVIGVNDYLGDQHDIELDEVYNKISVSANIYEIDKDDILLDPLDDTEKEYIPNSDGSFWYHVADSDDYRIVEKQFTLNEGQRWRSRYYSITNTKVSNDTIIDNAGDWDIYLKEYPTYHDTSGWSGNYINTICAVPTQYFSYDCSTDLPYKADWSDCISIYLQPEKFMTMHPQSRTDFSQWMTNLPDWYENYYHKNFFVPILEYVNPEYIRYSSQDFWSKKSYLVFKGDLQWANNHDHYAWAKADEETWYLEYPMTAYNIGKVEVKGRNNGDSKYNKGWTMLYCQLQIGDKYWNGKTWQKNPCRFGINYHEKNVVRDDEYLSLFYWNKPVTNHDYTYGINEEGWAIPLFNLYDENDVRYGSQVDLFGQLKFTIFTPICPWDNQFLDWGSGAFFQILKKMYPVVYMQGLNLMLKTVDSSYGWFHENEKQEDSNDDVIYSNIISMDNVSELDDIEVKINSYWEGKPNARSYLLTPTSNGTYNYLTNGLYDPYTNSRRKPEELVIEKYYEHHSMPKKKYNCQVKGYYPPYRVCTATALGPTKFTIDAQDFDVKLGQNTISLIEY